MTVTTALPDTKEGTTLAVPSFGERRLPWQTVLDTFLDAWTDSPATRLVYRLRVTQAMRAMAVPQVGDLTPLHLTSYRQRVMARTDWQPRTRTVAIAALRSFLKWCRSAGVTALTTDDLDLALKLPRARGGKRRSSTPDASVAALYAAAPPRHQALIAVLVGCGLRASEAAGLRVKHVHLSPPTPCLDVPPLPL
jgi:integrase